MIDFGKVERFIGRPWIYAENDCWAVARKAAKEIFNKDLPLVDLPSVSNLDKNINLFSDHASSKKWDKIDSPESGCMALFYAKINNVLSPVHVGIHIIDGNILHCDGSPKRGGSTTYDQIKSLVGKYRKYESVEFYKYANNDNS